MGWEVLSHPPYSPDLAPADYHLFGFVKNQMRGQHYETNEALQTAMRQCLRAAGTEFYRKGIFKLSERWEKCVHRNGDYVEQRFSNFFQVGTTFISQNVLRTTLLLGLSNSLGLP